MALCKHCLAAALSTAAATFMSAGAQTQVEGVVQPARPASQPVVHAVPLRSAESAPQITEKPAEKPAGKPAAKRARKPAHRWAHEPTHDTASQSFVDRAPPMLASPPLLPHAQPAPVPQAYAQPVPAPQPHAQPAPMPQPHAQPAPTSQPYAQSTSQPLVNWTLQVIRDGHEVDSFAGTSTVGQARAEQHHKVVTHEVGCMSQPVAGIDLQRTITVSPLRADPGGSVLAIQARETLESDSPSETPGGCKMPPQPRLVNAIHPGLVVPAGQWVSWQILEQDPSLQYRVRANLAPPANQP